MLRAQYAVRGPVPHEVIHCVESPTPEPAAGQVLLQVLAAPINPSDLLMLTGEYGTLPPLPAFGGVEGVGTVVAHGPGVSAPAVGTTVLLPAGCGTWSSHIVAEAATLIPLPATGDPVQLGMLTVNPPTALLMLRDFVSLTEGDWVIQNGGNSAVGGYVNQLAKLKGCRTVSVVRRESAIPAVEAADVVLVDGRDLAKRVAAATGHARVRLGLDCVAGSATQRLATCLAEGGTLVNYGSMSGDPCTVSASSLVFRDVTLRGFWLQRWFMRSQPAEKMAVFGELAQLVAHGQLSARVQATFDVRHVRDAVRLAARGEREGKVLITPQA